MSDDPIREQRTGFQPEPEFVTIADTVSHQGPPPEANDGPELPLTPDEHRRGAITQETAYEMWTVLRGLWSLAASEYGKATDERANGWKLVRDGISEVIAQAEKELRGEEV